MNRARILIVEDEPATSSWLRQVLEKFAFQTVLAEDGAQALALFTREQPDLVLLDLRLPAGSGVFVLDCIRRHPRLYNTPVVILSGCGDFGPVREMDLAADFFLKNPVENEALIQTIHTALAQAGGPTRIVEEAVV